MGASCRYGSDSIKKLSVQIDVKFGIIENIRIIVIGVTNYRGRMKCV